MYVGGELTVPPGWTPNGIAGTVAAPGFYDEATQTFTNLWYAGDDNSAIDTGNNAWAMIALLALYNRTQKPEYLDEARRLGEFINKFRQDTGTYRGLPRRADGGRGDAAVREHGHNLDVYAAFTAMAAATGEPAWADGAATTRRFSSSRCGTRCSTATVPAPPTRRR